MRNVDFSIPCSACLGLGLGKSSRDHRSQLCERQERVLASVLLPVRVVLSLDRLGLGKKGEDLARRELVRRGYAIAATRYRTRHGEIDIVARDGPTLVFVEVKARRSVRFGGAAEAVTWTKRRRITAMAMEYLMRERSGPGPYRFDVVAVGFAGEGRPAIEVIPGAFEAHI